MSKKSPIRKIFRIFLGVILGIVLLLLTTVTVILVTPGARTAVRSDHFGAEAELIATTMNLETMRVADS